MFATKPKIVASPSQGESAPPVVAAVAARPAVEAPYSPRTDPAVVAATARLGALAAAVNAGRARNDAACVAHLMNAQIAKPTSDEADLAALRAGAQVLSGEWRPPFAAADLDAMHAELRVLETAYAAASRELDRVMRAATRRYAALRGGELLVLAQRLRGSMLEMDVIFQAEKDLYASVRKAGGDDGYLPRLPTLVGLTTDSTGSPAYYASRELDHIIRVLEHN